MTNATLFRTHSRCKFLLRFFISYSFTPSHFCILQIYNKQKFPSKCSCVHFCAVLVPVLASIENDWQKGKSDRERRIMLKMARLGRIFTICGYSIMVMTFFGVTCSPMLGFSYRIFTNITDLDDRYLPVQSYYPYEFSKSPYFEISYCCQIVGICITACAFSALVNYFGVLVFHFSGQIGILGERIKRLHFRTSRDEHGFTTISKKVILRELTAIIEIHVRITK